MIVKTIGCKEGQQTRTGCMSTWWAGEVANHNLKKSPVKLMSQLHRVALGIRFPDRAVGQLQGLRQLHQSCVQDGVTVQRAPNLIRQHPNMPSRLFLILDDAHFPVQFSSLVL